LNEEANRRLAGLVLLRLVIDWIDQFARTRRRREASEHLRTLALILLHLLMAAVGTNRRFAAVQQVVWY
jgi:hypothetical protein